MQCYISHLLNFQLQINIFCFCLAWYRLVFTIYLCVAIHEHISAHRFPYVLLRHGTHNFLLKDVYPSWHSKKNRTNMLIWYKYLNFKSVIGLCHNVTASIILLRQLQIFGFLLDYRSSEVIDLPIKILGKRRHFLVIEHIFIKPHPPLNWYNATFMKDTVVWFCLFKFVSPT